MNTRRVFLCVVWISAVVLLSVSCSQEASSPVLTQYDDPQGRFSIGIPPGWEIAPEVSAWRLFAGDPSEAGERRFDASVGLTWGRPPCDWMQVDDVVAWYADRLSAGAGRLEWSRTETEIDGRRALQLEYEVVGQEGTAGREITWFTESFGIVWQITCVTMEPGQYDEYLSVFHAVGSSLRVHGSWSDTS